MQRRPSCDKSLLWVAHMVVVAFLFICSSGLATLHAQSQGLPVGLPAKAPGYERYFHSEQGATAFATRWGYRDGYEDGRRDMEFNKTSTPDEHDLYKSVPDHGLHPDIPRAKYKALYRSAYLNGYEYASKSAR